MLPLIRLPPTKVFILPDMKSPDPIRRLRGGGCGWLLCISLAAAGIAGAQQAEQSSPEPVAKAPVLGLFHRHPHNKVQQAWVTAANPLAVDAGIEILKRGGKAIDAAVAVQAVLGLVEPQSSGVGGGAFLMYYDARTHKVSAYDGREKAPAEAPPDMFLDAHGRPLPFVEAVRSGRSTGVPGAIAMLSSAHKKLGALHWQELFEPAIRLATQGIKVPSRLALFLGEGSPFPPTNEVRTLFARPDGQTLEEGDEFKNPDYAQTLQRIAQEGPGALYEGSIAEEIVRVTHLAPLPGTMTLKDLSEYRPEVDRCRCAARTAITGYACRRRPQAGSRCCRCSRCWMTRTLPRAARRTRSPGLCSRRRADSCTPTGIGMWAIRVS